MNDFKALYQDTWAKAARDTQETIELIQSWFPWIKWRPGKGALDEGPTDAEHPRAEPDIILLYDGEPILGVEVTGSDKMTWPCTVWIGKHKADFARACGYPVVYALYYNGQEAKRVISNLMVLHYAPYAVAKKPRGVTEYYHEVLPHFTQPLNLLKPYVEGALECAERDYRFREELDLLLFSGSGY